MAKYVSDYTFDNASRIGGDGCGLSQRNLQNVKSGNYLMTNFFEQECGMKKPIEFATSQPNVFYSGSQQVGIGGCNIDENSELRDGNGITHDKCKLSLNARPYSTIPYLGRGEGNPMVESQLQQGEQATNRKTVVNTTEKSYFALDSYPLVPSLQATVNNPANLVQEVASDGWIRGGIPSRELYQEAANGNK